MQNRKRITARRIIDICMTVLLICLMSYQVTGEEKHEWIGIGMTLLVIIHQILNRRWYTALFKGKYNTYRVTSTLINILLLAVIAVTAFCGIAMSVYAVPFFYLTRGVYIVRPMHLGMTHWSFVLMGLHLGLHIPIIFGKRIRKEKAGILFAVLFSLMGGIGLWLFLRNGMPNYLFFKVPFAFLDYEKNMWLVFLEHALMLGFWCFAGAQVAVLCIRKKDTKTGIRRFIPVLWITVSVLLGCGLSTVFPGENNTGFGSSGWGAAAEAEPAQTESAQGENEQLPAQTESIQKEAESSSDASLLAETPTGLNDGFVLLPGGSYLMGSPDTENWRIEDELRHEVRLSSFYMDPLETTQEDYARLMGTNPSEFGGDDCPVENITWMDAVLYANARSTEAGLTPAYTVTSDGVSWDRSAGGYRLPTEAEWEYACRAGTTTPFNTETSISTQEANYWGSYPYEIEENYFNTSVLETKPGGSEGRTVSVGSYPANAFGLYDMHGNVNEWCWDYYGSYNINETDNPTGSDNGTRHVYRGGGWNDFAKNLRSAYRAAGPSDMKSHNLGVRLVRNADDSPSGIVSAAEQTFSASESGNILIAYFSWGGNTRGIAQEIQGQTGADIFEITLLEPYSSDYNTVLMEAQRDQHHQARPELAEHIENMEDYDIILLGYPNWWASIPMPVASFLEEYDFAGKRIIPFCSHGGGRFGQSLTAIAKLAPDAVLGEGLAINYSGGASMPDDVAVWLKENGI